MADRRSLGKDAWGEFEEFVEFDDAGNATVSFEGDNTARMEANKVQQNDGSNGFNQARDMRKIIELDPSSIMLIATMYGVRPMSAEFDEVVLSLAQSSEWRNIKTVDGGIRKRMH